MDDKRNIVAVKRIDEYNRFWVIEFWKYPDSVAAINAFSAMSEDSDIYPIALIPDDEIPRDADIIHDMTDFYLAID